MNVITLTLSPAFDIHCYTENFAAESENLVRVTSRCAGGKGVNISRALLAGGVQSTALAVLGEDNADAFICALERDGIDLCALSVPGRIRENITVHTENASETRISFPSPTVDTDILDRVFDALDSDLTEGTVLTLTGRMPDGIGMDDIMQFLEKLTARGVRTVIDSKSFSLSELVRARPWLIKPNEQEISDYLGRTVSGFDDVADAARDLHAGGIANVLVSLGDKGAMLACDAGIFVATPPTITPLSTIGAGDSTIAGFLSAASRGADAKVCLIHAVAFGTAACLTEGTLPPRAEDIAKVLDDVKLTKL